MKIHGNAKTTAHKTENKKWQLFYLAILEQQDDENESKKYRIYRQTMRKGRVLVWRRCVKKVMYETMRIAMNKKNQSEAKQKNRLLFSIVSMASLLQAEFISLTFLEPRPHVNAELFHIQAKFHSLFSVAFFHVYALLQLLLCCCRQWRFYYHFLFTQKNSHERNSFLPSWLGVLLLFGIIRKNPL